MELDWKAYFLSFCERHGEPVEHAGRLLFPDGWTYSLSDYEGPEWGPPADFRELDELVMRYWVVRYNSLNRRLLILTHRHQQLRDLTSAHSLPVKQAVVIETERGVRRGYRDLDLAPLTSTIDWVRADIAEAELRLREIEESFARQRSTA